MRMRKVFAVGTLLVGLLFALPATKVALAQDAPPEVQDDQGQDSPAQDPSGRVAQLSYASGSVSFQPSGQGDWVQAVTNRPLTAGDNLWADRDSRAELHLGSTAIRMDSETSLTFLDLDDHTTQIKLSMGSLVVRVRHLDDGDTFEVDTPNLAFNIQRTGEYRIDVNSDGNLTNVTVRQGRGEATGGGDSYLVVAGQQARFSGTDQLDHEISQLPGSDDFDGWSSGRDQSEDRSESANYVSPEMTGYEDLDTYGSWTYQAGYGACWSPASVAVDWAPYRYGHWVWIAPWGWTWVEDEPWGFAPFHYGRWAYVTNRWFWVPGRVFVRPVYAPALVAFVGGGGFHLSVGVGGPGVAWFPLAPGEVYMPWYRTSRGYVNNVNITNTRVNVTQVTNVYNVYNSRTTVNATHITYVNQRTNNAVTAVSRDTFVNARPVGRSFARVDEKQLAAAPANYRPEEQPVRSSVMGTGAPARFQPPTAVMNRQAVATRMPAAPPRAPFEQSRPAINVRTEPAGVPQPADRGQNLPQQQNMPRSNAQRPAEPIDNQRGTQNPNNNTPRPDMRSQQQPQQVTPRNDVQRPSQPVPQPMDNQRGMQNQNNNNNVPRPDVRPQQPVPPNRGDLPNRQMDERQVQRPSQPNPPAQEMPNRPQVRSAPPVQERPEMQRSEQQKFDSWQQQRPRQEAAPRPSAPAPRASQPPPRQEAPARAPQPQSHEDHHK
jgi:hypothetical protein